jgi:hypothetical protein
VGVDVDMRLDNHINIAKPLKGLVLWVSTGKVLEVTGQPLLEVAGRLLSQSADSVAARKTAATACSSLMISRWGVLFNEAWWSQRVDLTGSHLSLHRSSEVVLSISSKLLLVLLLSSSAQVLATLQSMVSQPVCGGPWPDFNFPCLTVGAHDQILIFFVWQFLSSSCRAPSLTRGQVCNLQCNHSLVRVAQDP